MHTKTIASIASGMGGGIGVIRISGDDAMTIAGKIFRKRSQIDLSSECEKEDVQSDDKFFEKTDTHTIHYGFIVDEGKVVDEVMVLVMKKPNSYTREDVIEIDSHGGPFIVKKILETVLKNGAAIHDIEQVIRRRFPLVQVMLFPAQVQGDSAPESISHAIQRASQSDCDILIVGRGGGSAEDLQAFQTEEVVMAVFHCSIPVISAVGHEIDQTLDRKSVV